MTSLDEILKMANDVQEKISLAQESLDQIEVEGVSGGGMVKVVASAKGRIISLDIDSSLLNIANKEMMEDLVVAAFNAARSNADQRAHKEMQKLTAGMPLPPGFKF